MAEIVVNIAAGGQETVPIRRCGGVVDYKPRPKTIKKVSKVDDTIIKNIRTEALAVRNYMKLDLNDEADNAIQGIKQMVNMLEQKED